MPRPGAGDDRDLAIELTHGPPSNKTDVDVRPYLRAIRAGLLLDYGVSAARVVPGQAIAGAPGAAVDLDLGAAARGAAASP